MNEFFQMELSSPITDEEWAIITDAELERTSEITFNTPSGKKVAFIKKPTVEAVEVVRCKDCKHRPHIEKAITRYRQEIEVCAPMVDGREDYSCMCLNPDNDYFSWMPDDNWFCADGERRKDEGK